MYPPMELERDCLSKMATLGEKAIEIYGIALIHSPGRLNAVNLLELIEETTPSHLAKVTEEEEGVTPQMMKEDIGGLKFVDRCLSEGWVTGVCRCLLSTVVMGGI